MKARSPRCWHRWGSVKEFSYRAKKITRDESNALVFYRAMCFIPAVKANPGGQISPENIYGRDEIIASYWRILDGQGIYINDLRRIGKTQIMVKMHAEPPSGWVTVKADLGRCHTAAEFATRAFKDSHAVLSGKNKTLRTMEKWFGKLGELEIAGVLKLPGQNTVAPWKEVLERTFADLEEAMTAMNCRMVFFWDEVPFLLDNIARKEGPETAMEVLDTLRSLAQDYDRVRLFLTGSIGLHHVLASLKEDGYIGTPLNRMAHCQPGPLEKRDAQQLAQALINGEQLHSNDASSLAAHIANLTGNVAFYIHLLISRLAPGENLTPASVTACLKQQLVSKAADWDLPHYQDRLPKYYGTKAVSALHVLDALAAGKSLGFAEIRNAVATKIVCDEDELRKLLELLCSDHYLVKSQEGYAFYLEIVRHWWALTRNP